MINELIYTIKNWLKGLKPKQKFVTIDFEEEDLQRLDVLQNKILGTSDGCQSVGYKNDRQIFELCLEMIERIFRDCMVGNTNINTETKFGYVKEIHYFMEVYFSYHLKNKLV